MPTTNDVLNELRRQHFAVLATADREGHPASAGVTYALSHSEDALYIMTRRHLQKVRNIAANPEVALLVSIPRRLLVQVPPATIQLRGQAQILDSRDEEGNELFSSFWLGRRILKAYRQLQDQGENRVCFLRAELDPVIHTYMVRTPLWQLVRKGMESGSATIVRR